MTQIIFEGNKYPGVLRSLITQVIKGHGAASYAEFRKKNFSKESFMGHLRSDNLMDNPLEEKMNSVIQEKGDHLYAFTRGEDVYLSGEVSCRAVKEEISYLIKIFPGIRIVTNHIRLKLPEERRRIEHF